MSLFLCLLMLILSLLSLIFVADLLWMLSLLNLLDFVILNHYLSSITVLHCSYHRLYLNTSTFSDVFDGAVYLLSL